MKRLLRIKNFHSSHALGLSMGFTLVELLVVIAIIGILATGLLAAINPKKHIDQAQDSKVKNDIDAVARAMQAYNVSTSLQGTFSYYPSEVSALVSSGDLKIEPKHPVLNTSYNVVGTPPGCLTANKDCTNIAVWGDLSDAPTGQVWCWKSADNSVGQIAQASCTP